MIWQDGQNNNRYPLLAQLLIELIHNVGTES